jgi:hypothetical protein
MFNLFGKSEQSYDDEKLITNHPDAEYYIDCKLGISAWDIKLLRKLKTRDVPDIISSEFAWNEKERESIIANFKSNKNKLIKSYENKESKNIKIPL